MSRNNIIQYSEEHVPLELTRWANKFFSRPRIDPAWLAECYEWFCDEHKVADIGFIDFAELRRIVVERFLLSNLEDSTIHGTGFGATSSPTTGHLQGLPLIVQVVACKEFLAPSGRRVFKFQLSDGETTTDAIAHAVSQRSTLTLNFDKFELGFKIRLFNPILRRGVIRLKRRNSTFLGGRCDDLEAEQVIVRERRIL